MLEIIIVLQVVAGTVSMVLVINALQRRSSPQALSLAATMICASIWVFGFAAEIMAPTLNSKIIWANIQFLGISFLPIFWLLLVMYSLGYPRHAFRIIPILTIIPIITNLVIWTNSYHHIFRINPSIITKNVPFPILSSDYGIYFNAVHVPYSYFLFLASLTILIHSLWRSPTIYRRQRIILTFSLFLPLLVDILYVLGITPIKDFNFTSIVFVISGLFISGSVLYLRFLDILPLAYEAAINEMNVGVIVLDAQWRVSHINPKAEKITGIRIDQDIGVDARQLFPPLEHLCKSAKKRSEVEVIQEGREFVYQLQCSKILGARKKLVGKVVTLHDISERAKLHEMVELLSITDPLTGALNRRALTQRGELEIQQAHRYKRDMSLILIDVDNFKDINDTFGHQVGDELLKDIVEVVSESIRNNDLVYRYGGDEFVVILPDTRSGEAIEVAERIRHSVTKAIMNNGDERKTQEIFISMGVTSLLANDDLDSLLYRADQALYLAKSSGKDQVVSNITQ